MENKAVQEAELIDEMVRNLINTKNLLSKYKAAKTDRDPWVDKWEVIGSLLNPDMRSYRQNTTPGFFGAFQQPKTKDANKHTGYIAGKIFSIINTLMSSLIDPSIKWFELKFENKVAENNQHIREWARACEDVLYETFSHPDSGFYSSTYQFLHDWYTIGTACRDIKIRGDTGRINFKAVPMSNICFDLSAYDEVGVVYRTYFFNINQAYELWGDRLHGDHLQQLKVSDNNYANKKMYEFVEICIKNPMKDFFGFGTDYICVTFDVANEHLINYTFQLNIPYIISRFFTAPGDTYGRSYVWNIINDIKLISRLEQRTIQGVDFASLPVILAKDISSFDPSKFIPGGIVKGLDTQGSPLFQQMPFSGDLNVGMSFASVKTQQIDETLLVNDIIPDLSGNMTATEILERKIIASNKIRPLLVLLEKEDLHRTICRTLFLLNQSGKLPEFPYEKAGIDPMILPAPLLQLGVKFSGMLSRMHKMQDLLNLKLFLQDLSQVATIKPDVIDIVNADSILEEELKYFNLPNGIIQDPAVVQMIREERQKQERMQRQAQMEALEVQNESVQLENERRRMEIDNETSE